MSLSFLGMVGAVMGGEAPRIGRDVSQPSGIEVSTVNAPDVGPETALFLGEDVCPVERYASEEEARAGHARWVERAGALKTGDTVTMLGYGDLIEDREVEVRL